MNRDYQLGCVNYIPTLLFYLVTIFITIGVFFTLQTDSNINIIIKFLLSIIYLILIIFTLYYHFKSMKISNKIDYDKFLIDPQNEAEKKDNYCNICKSNRPKRSHHCRICGVCTLKMDHHCPWISNCVGENNEREFIYFLFGITTTCIFVFVLTIKYFFDFIKNGKKYYDYNLQDNYFISTLKDIVNCFKLGCCPISFVIGLTSFFLIWNYIFNNIKYNMTSIEMLIYRNYEECPDYNNNLEENLKRVLKPYPIINLFNRHAEDINDELEYKNFNEENINLLNKEKEI